MGLLDQVFERERQRGNVHMSEEPGNTDTDLRLRLGKRTVPLFS